MPISSRRIRHLLTPIVIVAASTAIRADVTNGGFELPDIGTTNYQYLAGTTAGSSNTNNGWTYSDNGSGGGGSGVATHGANFLSGAQAAPDGDQVAFVQVAGASVSQDVAVTAGTYDVTFEIAGRGDGSGVSTYSVIFGGQTIATGSTTTGSAFAPLMSVPVTLPTGTSTLRFVNTFSDPAADSAFLLDSVKVNAVPEPASLTLLGFAGVGLLRRRSVR